MNEIPATLSIRPQVLTAGGRVGLLCVVGILFAAEEPAASAWLWLLALLAVALLSLVTSRARATVRIGHITEVVIAGLAASYATGAEGVTIPYIAAPVFAAGIFTGVSGMAPLIALAGVVVAGSGVASGAIHNTTYLVQGIEWLIMSTALGLLGIWIRSLARSASTEPGYTQATRLLTQLRTIARQLPGTLDPGSIAERLLEELAAQLPADRAAVFTASGGGRLEVLAQRTPERVAWETSVTTDNSIADAWASQQPQISGRTLVRSDSDEGSPSHPSSVSSVVLPLVTGVRTVGLVALETDRAHAYTSSDLISIRELTTPAALRLETALLFDEVRSLATTQERHRLAREIHDGIAQELVIVGYGIDNAIASIPDDNPAAEELHTLRAEVTRVITELRLSLFELRSDVDRYGGLGSAIAEYARTVGTSAGLRVHLSLDESTARLPAAIEGELLRIAQEAMTNARKHSGAHNLWVTCEIDPPHARIEIVDDGTGMPATHLPTDRAASSYGLSIMAERAERIRARFEITDHEPSGTIVSVELGG